MLVAVNGHNQMYKFKSKLNRSSGSNEDNTSKSISIKKSDESSNMTEHERMLQLILTNEVDPWSNDRAHTSDNGNEVLGTTTHHSTNESMQEAVDVITEINEFENVLNETKRSIQVLCLWC